MPKTPPADFEIHVDPSCLSSSMDATMSPERSSSNQTIIHHDVEEAPREISEDEANLPKEETNDEEKRSQDARERQLDRIEAQIQAAARAVVASIEEDNYTGEDSVLSAQTDESYDPENSLLDYGTGTDLSYNPGSAVTDNGTELTNSTPIEDDIYDTEGVYEPEDDQNGEGDSSSHHDGDIDDDVFSNSDHSKRSSLNSLLDVNSADEQHGKALTSPTVGEEAASQPVSRIPSNTSYAPHDTAEITPSRVLARPPFRTPSSVRAIQMGSPTPSLYSSPRSTKRHVPSVSRIGTPSSPFSQSKRTPTRFKTKKEAPLVLLHVTVLPLTWTYSHVMASANLPQSLQKVKYNWSLLHGQLGEAVLERGILLPHPQDDYEVLEERVLEALELPVRPRAKILKCGHYMGPDTSDDEGTDSFYQDKERKWCDICGRDVKFEASMDESGEKRFRVKIYASNGLMRAGAWAACWREMERVDVELEPYIEGDIAMELDQLAAVTPASPTKKDVEIDDGFVDEEEHDQLNEEREAEEARQLAEDEALMEKIEAERRKEEEEALERKRMDEERMREIYGAPVPEIPHVVQQEHPVRRQTASGEEESLPELMLTALKIAMRDRKNVAILVLSFLVLLLALKPKSVIMSDPAAARDATVHGMEPVPTMVVDVPGTTAVVTQETAIPKAPEVVVEANEPEAVPPVACKVEPVAEVVPTIKQQRKVQPQQPKAKARAHNTVPAHQKTKPIVKAATGRKASPQLEIAPAKQPEAQREIESTNQDPSHLEIHSEEESDSSLGLEKIADLLEVESDDVPQQAEHNDPDLKEVVMV